MKRSVRIQKGSSTARDKRMGVVNELIGSVSPILFSYSLPYLVSDCRLYRVGEVHQIFRMGGAVDKADVGCKGG
jgi:hypothetical protein